MSTDTTHLSLTDTELETWEEFDTRVSTLPPVKFIINGLQTEDSTTLDHGMPRSFKTLTQQAKVVHLVSGSASFGPFGIPKPLRVAYVTQEDSERMTHQRFEQLFNGLKRQPRPGHLRMLVRRGLCLDDPAHRVWLAKQLDKAGSDFCLLEPMRSLTALAEKTSAEFKPIMDWVRRIQSYSTCKTFEWGHHNTKTPRSGKDEREESEKASGGALFSSSDFLLSFKREDWQTGLITPSRFKPCSTPDPFRIFFDTDTQHDTLGNPQFGKWINPVITSVSAKDAANATQERVAKTLQQYPWITLNEVAELAIPSRVGEKAGMDANAVRPALEVLMASYRVEMATQDEAKACGRWPTAKLYGMAGTPYAQAWKHPKEAA
jgi:hypothetical protein